MLLLPEFKKLPASLRTSHSDHLAQTCNPHSGDSSHEIPYTDALLKGPGVSLGLALVVSIRCRRAAKGRLCRVRADVYQGCHGDEREGGPGEGTIPEAAPARISITDRGYRGVSRAVCLLLARADNGHTSGRWGSRCTRPAPQAYTRMTVPATALAPKDLAVCNASFILCGYARRLGTCVKSGHMIFYSLARCTDRAGPDRLQSLQ
jgi:hypothetical protein